MDFEPTITIAIHSLSSYAWLHAYILLSQNMQTHVFCLWVVLPLCAPHKVAAPRTFWVLYNDGYDFLLFPLVDFQQLHLLFLLSHTLFVPWRDALQQETKVSDCIAYCSYTLYRCVDIQVFWIAETRKSNHHLTLTVRLEIDWISHVDLFAIPTLWWCVRTLDFKPPITIL